MRFEIEDALRLLARAPATLTALLSALPEAWARCREGPGTWSPHEVVGHLIHGEQTDWVPRVRAILAHGTERPFEPFDRTAQERESVHATLDQLLGRFAELRAANLAALGGLDLGDADLDRAGMHPELGRVTLRQLLATWTAHDLGHVRQICRVLAKQYADEVAPWRAYLPVVRESGGEST
jgi:hypothetical protein